MRCHVLVPFLGLAACSAPPEIEQTTQAIANPTQQGVPPSVGRVVIEGIRHGEQDMDGCHAQLIAPRWAITAAHCFEDFTPQGASITVLDQAVTASALHFHPETWGNGHTSWTTAESGTDPVHDIALVELPAASAFSVVRLWHPSNPLNALSAGQLLTVTGSNNGFFNNDEEATGTMEFLSLLDFGNGWMIEAKAAPSSLQPGDSGGGVFITSSGSVPYSDPCAPAPAAANQQALIGINKSSASTAHFVPVYVPEIADWIVSLTHDDGDGDGACNAVDNCAAIANPDQANCNATAETAPAWGGAVLGDACDPTPCPAPLKGESDFVVATQGLPKPSGDGLVTTSWGRAVRDQLAVLPILADGSTKTSSATPRFCLCRDAVGAPLPLEACQGAPFHCTLDPAQAGANVVEIGGAGAPLANQTYWHELTTDAGGATSSGAAIPVTYPGAAVVRTWHYETDHAAWHAAGWVANLPQDAKYGPGTDLGGWMWTHDTTTKGSAAHGGLRNPADGFAPAAPDPRVSRSSYHRIPRYAPNPWWTFCAMCGDKFRFPGEGVYEPAPFVTVDLEANAFVWTQHGGSDANQALSLRLRRALVDTASLFVGASEPAVVTRSQTSPRQLQLAANGTAVLGSVIRRTTGFDLAPSTPVGSLAPSARRGFAAAWSRTANALFLAGGVDANQRTHGQVWTWRSTTGFSMVRVATASAPSDTESAVFSPADGRLWIIDRTSTGRRLIRIDPLTGLATVGELPRGADLDAAWLTTLESGAVVLVGAIGDRHRVVSLAVSRFRFGASVVAAAQREGVGAPLGPPTVANGTIQIAIAAGGRDTQTIRALAIAAP